MAARAPGSLKRSRRQCFDSVIDLAETDLEDSLASDGGVRDELASPLTASANSTRQATRADLSGVELASPLASAAPADSQARGGLGVAHAEMASRTATRADLAANSDSRQRAMHSDPGRRCAGRDDAGGLVGLQAHVAARVGPSSDPRPDADLFSAHYSAASSLQEARTRAEGGSLQFDIARSSVAQAATNSRLGSTARPSPTPRRDRVWRSANLGIYRSSWLERQVVQPEPRAPRPKSQAPHRDVILPIESEDESPSDRIR